jgi:two-component system response regulator AtoC
MHDLFLAYEWPGNVRELENMVKRFVILQDEQLVIRELRKPRMVPAPRSLTPTAAEAEQLAPPPFHAPSPPVEPDTTDNEDGDDEEAPAPPATDGRRLVDVAREAALAAERSVISDTLRQVHWNRRKAAQLLGVSYKTLLNKIKETGIERP